MAIPKKRNKRHTKVEFDFSPGILDNYIKLFFSENSLISSSLISKVRELFELADLTVYEDDIDMYLRINTIQILLEKRLDDRVTDSDMLIAAIHDVEDSDVVAEIIEGVFESGEIGNEDLKFIDGYTNDRIKYAHLFKYLPMFEDLSLQLKSGNFSISKMNEKAIGVIDAFNTEIKVAKTTIDAASNDFSSMRTETERATEKVIKTNKDSVGLRTAVKELNRTLNGRFYNGRFYLLMAAPKRGKSTTLLNLAIQCKHVNKDIKTKDPTKRPAIVYLTQENTVHETIERLWSYYFGSERLSEISDYTVEEAIEKLNEAGFMNDDDENDGIVFCVKYRKNKSITAQGIKDIIDGMSEEGLECVGLFHDYLKRLRAKEKGSDERIEYGNVSNDLSELCKELDIPIISAMQLSRKAVEILENKALNAGKNLGSSLISESFLVIENVDAAMIINLTKTKDGKTYMFFKLTEPRYKVPDDANWDFYQPFDHGMRMLEDWDHAESKAVLSLSSDLIVSEGDDGGDLAAAPITRKREIGSASNKKGIIPSLKLDAADQLFDEGDEEL